VQRLQQVRSKFTLLLVERKPAGSVVHRPLRRRIVVVVVAEKGLSHSAQVWLEQP
jgi:ureidoglycolate hydrolase